jgi:arabinogalactan oligomer / maltooligosaccharide transport system permease protein
MLARSVVPPQGSKGILIALAVVTAIIGLSFGIGWGVSLLTPAAPAYLLLVYAGVALIPIMILALRIFPWVVNWYYLMPSIVFLAAFTIYPIILTINFAFTNYSALNSGEPDAASRMEIQQIALDRKSLVVKDFAVGLTDLKTSLNCDTEDCAGRKVALLADGGQKPISVTIERIATKYIYFTAPAPQLEGAALTSVTRFNQIQYVGLGNFQEIFSKASVELWPIFGWTVIFALSTILINTVAGLFLGILMANKRLKFRNLYRTLLILPWAVPMVISVQMWVALFNQNFGIVNRVLALLGSAPIPWLADPLWAKIAILIVNLWLGFPYMMTATISSLAGISEDLYEAASIDGATRWQQIQAITLPLLRQSFTPILLSGFAFNFNNFGIIYLLTQGGPAVVGNSSTGKSTDILISWGYNNAFVSGGGSNFGFASAIAVIIAFLTIGISMVSFRAAGVFEEAKK